MQARSASIQNRKILCYYNGSNSRIDRKREREKERQRESESERESEMEREKERGRKVDVKNKRTNSQRQVCKANSHRTAFHTALRSSPESRLIFGWRL